MPAGNRPDGRELWTLCQKLLKLIEMISKATTYHAVEANRW
jgi:hypothetical protein